jgi:hypothetical protein
VHFVGNARVEAVPVPDATTQVAQVRTFNRLQNHRSLLCERQEYRRQNRSSLEFQEEADSYTVDFCFGTPRDPLYPEGVVVALLRGAHPAGGTESASPTGKSFLTTDAELPAELMRLKGFASAEFRIWSVSTQGTVASRPDAGEKCSEAKVAASEGSIWWCGRERAQVITEIVEAGRLIQVTWHLISVTDDQASADVYWRVERAELW